jgi:hypothetical protein
LPDFQVQTLADNALAEGWAESETSYTDVPRFLGPTAVRQAAAWTELSDEAIEDCVETAGLIGSDSELSKLAWHAHRSIYLSGDRPNISSWPTDIIGLGAHTGTFYLILALSGIEPMVQFHHAHGIPEPVSRLNCRDIHIWAREYKTLGEPTQTGFSHTFDSPRWGLHTRGFSWTSRSLIGQILRLGRLQFIHAPYRSNYRAYRHASSGRVQVIAQEGHRFTNEGWKTTDDDSSGWPSQFAEKEDLVTATPVSPDGRAIREPVTLNKAESTCVLKAGDPILEIHIPEDGSMDFEACGTSIEEVIRDFTTYFPDKPFNAIVCGSWLLDPQFQDGMRESSNICRFQRECYLYPIGPGGGRSGFFRLFTHDNIATLPRDTVMRRTYLDLLESGDLWRGGGMMLFPEDLDWGQQVYLKQHAIQ